MYALPTSNSLLTHLLLVYPVLMIATPRCSNLHLHASVKTDSTMIMSVMIALNVINHVVSARMTLSLDALRAAELMYYCQTRATAQTPAQLATRQLTRTRARLSTRCPICSPLTSLQLITK